MLCCYLDDAGNTGNDLDDTAQPIHYNGALVVSEEQWLLLRDGARKIRDLALIMGYKGPFEFHGVNVFQGQKNGQSWGAIKFKDRLDLYAQALELLKSNKIPILLGCCNKKSLKATYTNRHHPHRIAMLLCLERIAKYAARKQSLALVVADDCSPSVRDIARKVLHDYKTRGAPYGTSVDFDLLIDTIHFMVSNYSPHIQLCDMALYAIRRYEATQDPKIKEIAAIALGLVEERGTIP